jgi:DEAD/DEAH box helicase domain-containing protein
MKFEVFFDCETKKLFSEIEGFNPRLLEASIVSLYQRTVDENYSEKEGKLISFWEKDFDKIWQIFSSADRIIGFNSFGFDIEVLQPYAPYNLKLLPHFDIMEEVKKKIDRRISLNALAKETLDKEKSDIGVNAVLYWQSGTKENLEKLRKYCEMDVIISKELYDFGLKNHFLKFKDRWNTPRTVSVNFGYPQGFTLKKQEGLF